MNKAKVTIFLILGMLITLTLSAGSSVIKAGDEIKVWVKGESDLTVERVVGDDGSISFPLLGSVGVAGMTPHQAAKVLSGLLEDGYLRDPLVQITKSKKAVKRAKNTSYIEGRSLMQSDSRVSSAQGYTDTRTAAQQKRFEVVDRETGRGLNGVAMLLDNHIYQSNRLGQIVAHTGAGDIVLIADGYKILSGSLENFVDRAEPGKIKLDRIKLSPEVSFHVIDAITRKPLEDVEVVLDNMKISTNSKGSFKIKKIQREFGEVFLRKKGYRDHRLVVDFKGPQNQLILMVRNE